VRHVIIEGPDGAGKTKLAELICSKTGLKYHHEGPPPTNLPPVIHYARLLEHATESTVFDRLHLGELVYGPLLRGTVNDPNDLTLMRRLIQARGHYVVVCLPPWETCLENNRQKEEFIKDEDTLRQAYEAWSFVVNQPEVSVNQILDYTDKDSKLQKFKTFHSPLPNGTIGSPDANVLLISERATGHSLDLPLFDKRYSSEFLDDCLLNAGFEEQHLAFTTALTLNGGLRPLRPIISELPNLKVIVALGNTAMSCLQYEKIQGEIVQLPAPDFWTKFHPKKPREYTRMLEVVHARTTVA